MMFDLGIMGHGSPSNATGFTNNSTTENVLSGSYTGTVAINEPLALGILDISLTLTDTDGTLSGVLNQSGSLAFPSAAALQGSITGSIDGITPTFRIDTAAFSSLVSGRQVTRSFRMEGEVHDRGDVITGVYIETISGFTPQALVVNGRFLASRARSAGSAGDPGTATPTSMPTATPAAGVATATPTPTRMPGVVDKIYLPIIKR